MWPEEKHYFLLFPRKSVTFTKRLLYTNILNNCNILNITMNLLLRDTMK